MKVLVVPQAFHGGAIHSIDINKSGRVITSGEDKYVSEWSPDLFDADFSSEKSKDKAKNVKPQLTHKYHKACVSIVRWSPSVENVFASGDVTGEVYLNTGSNKKPKKVFPLEAAKVSGGNEAPKGVVDLTWSSDGRLLSWSTQDRKLHLYDTVKETYQEFSFASKAPSSTSTTSNTAGAATSTNSSTGAVGTGSSTTATSTSNANSSSAASSSSTSSKKASIPAIQRSIAFDPTGNYFITLGDDSLIHLYQYQYDLSTDLYKFKQIQKISKLVNNMAFNSNYKRISWSPDGEYVCIPTANKNSTSLVSLISRSKNWTNIISLVGHDVNCEVAKFNSNFYTSAKKETNETSDISSSAHPYNVIATAGSDKTLVIWNTSNDSPILVLRDLAKEPITDLCWNFAGDKLVTVSLDGHLTIINFDEKELGEVADAEVVSRIEVEGKKSIKAFDHKDENEAPSNKRGQNNVQEFIDQKNAVNVNASEDPNEEDVSKEVKVEESKPEVKQKKNTAADSKKTDSLVPEVIQPPKFDDPTVAASSTIASEDILQSAMGRSKSNNQSSAASVSTTSAPAAPKTITPSPSTASQKVTTKNGKKRIQPMLISNNGSNSNSISNSISSTLTSENGVANTRSINTPLAMEFDKPSYSVTEDVFKQSKRNKNPDGSSSNGGVSGGANKKLKRQLEPVRFLETTIVNPNTTYAKVRLSIPKVRLSFQLESKYNDEIFVLDIKNGSGNEAKPSRITYYKKDKEIWSDFVPRFIQLATEGKNYWALSTMDGQVLVYSKDSGRRVLPPLVLGSPLSFLESHGEFLMAVSSIGELYVWNIALRKIHLHGPSSLASILELSNKYKEDGLSKSDNITMCSITSSGVPLLTISNGTGYLFNKDLGIWQTITESWWAFGSHYWDSVGDEASSSRVQSSNLLGTGSRGNNSSIVGLLEQKTNEEILRKTRLGRGKHFNKISKNMIMKEGFESLENTISLSHLENRILCCELLGETSDFKKFFVAYAKRVCELSLKPKLYEICNQLLGPPSEYKDSVSIGFIEKDRDYEDWVPKVCGIDKHELLKEIVLACSKHRDSQRILLHFARELKLVDQEIDFQENGMEIDT